MEMLNGAWALFVVHLILQKSFVIFHTYCFSTQQWSPERTEMFSYKYID